MTTPSVRELFDAVCDLPADARRARLAQMTGDVARIDQVLALLDAQTESLGRAVAPLSALMARLPDTELEVGDTLGPWRLSERLASGGMGTVFVAERADAQYTQRVAIKLLRGATGPDAAERLAAERQILADLAHPRIARLYDGGSTPAGHPYLVMEYVDGKRLDAWLADTPPLEARIALFEDIARTVGFAHQHLVLHCDLKPGNVLVRADDTPVLLDFGIARLLGESDDGGGHCTPAYASPELLRGGRVSVQSDVYSLGVLLAEMLGGPAPRDVARPEAPITAPSMRPGAGAGRARVAGDLDAIVARATQADPTRRYAGVDALLDDIARWRTHRPVRAREGGAGYVAARFLRRRWRPLALGAAAVLATTAFVWQLASERTRAQEAARTAEQVSDFLVEAFSAADPRSNADAPQVSARQVLDAGVARVDRDLADSPVVRARLQLTLGQAYRNLGQSQRAIELLRESIDGFLAVGRPLQAAEALSQLSVELRNAHDGQGALAAARRMIELREAAGAGDAATRADSLNTLGLALTAVEDFDGARDALLESLRLRRALGAEGADDIASTLLNLGLLHRESEQLDAAADWYRQARDAAAARGGAARPTYVNAIDGLARVHRMRNELDAALPLQREALAVSRTLYGPDSAHVGRIHNELANVLHDMARYGEAERHYREAARIDRAARGADSPSYAVNLNNLASLYEDRGDIAGAEALFRQSLAIRRAALPADDPLVRRSESNLARLLVRRGAHGEATGLIAPVLAQRRAQLAADHTDRVRIELLEAERLLRAGDATAAARALAAIAPTRPDPASPLSAQRMQLAADIAEARGDMRAALDLRTRALAHLRGIGTAQQTQAARLAIDLARAHLATGERATAQRLLADAERVLRPALVPQAPAWMEWNRLHAQAGATPGPVVRATR